MGLGKCLHPSVVCSSDLTDEELRERVGHMEASRIPTLVLMSGADEYMPKHVDPKALASRLATFMGPNTKPVCVEGGDHALSNCPSSAVEEITAFIRSR